MIESVETPLQEININDNFDYYYHCSANAFAIINSGTLNQSEGNYKAISLFKAKNRKIDETTRYFNESDSKKDTDGKGKIKCAFIFKLPKAYTENKANVMVKRGQVLEFSMGVEYRYGGNLLLNDNTKFLGFYIRCGDFASLKNLLLLLSAKNMMDINVSYFGGQYNKDRIVQFRTARQTRDWIPIDILPLDLAFDKIENLIKVPIENLQ